MKVVGLNHLRNPSRTTYRVLIRKSLYKQEKQKFSGLAIDYKPRITIRELRVHGFLCDGKRAPAHYHDIPTSFPLALITMKRYAIGLLLQGVIPLCHRMRPHQHSNEPKLIMFIAIFQCYDLLRTRFCPQSSWAAVSQNSRQSIVPLLRRRFLDA